MKKFISIFAMLILLIITYEILSEAPTIVSTVKYSFQIWIGNIFPALFPFFVLSEILINFGFVELFGELFKPLFEKVFKINGNASFVFFMSLVSGFPSSSKYARELYLENKLNEFEATKILMFSHFSNPLFILGTVYTFINDQKMCFLIMIAHYLSNIIIGLLIRNYHQSKIIKTKFSIKKALSKMHNKRISNKKPISIIITNSLINSINTLLLILGVVTTCLIITTIIDNNFHLPLIYKTILSGSLEITQGLKHVSLLNYSIFIKSLIITSFLSFGGISVHMQIISIISDTKIRYLPFLLARILHVIISIILVMICFNLL